MNFKMKVFIIASALTMLFSIPTMAAIGTPTNLHQTDCSTNYVDIKWDTVLSDSDIYYEVLISADGVNWEIESSSCSSNEDYFYGLSTGTTYYVKVRAFDYYTDEYGAYSDVLKITTAPEEPESISQTAATTNSMTITWSACVGATSYNVYKEENEIETLIGTTTSTSYTIGGLDNTKEIPFSIFVKAVRDIGTYKVESRYDAWLSRINMTLQPVKISNIEVAYYTSSNSINLDADAEHAVGYEYECYDINNKKIDSGSFSYSVEVKNIKLNQFYKVRVRAFSNLNNNKVYGDWSDYKYIAHQTQITKAKVSKGKINLKWKKIKGATNYTIYVSTSGYNTGYKKVGTTKKASFVVKKIKKKKIKKGKTYYIRVIASKKVGNITYKSNDDDYVYKYAY